MKTFACLICVALIAVFGLPRAEQAAKTFEVNLRQNIACTAAMYAALDTEAEADFERAEELCAEL